MISTQAHRAHADRSDPPRSVARLGFARLAWALVVAVGFAGFAAAVPVAPSQSDQPGQQELEREAKARVEEERQRWAVWAEVEHQWGAMERAEDLIVLLTPQMARLSDAVLNLELPYSGTRSLFASMVAFRDLAPGRPELRGELAGLAVKKRSWPSAPVATAASAELRLWQPLFDEVLYFSAAAFKIKLGHFSDSTENEFDAEVHFEGEARSAAGRVFSIHAVQRVVWRNQTPERKGAKGEWRIVYWSNDDFKVMDGRSPLFREVLATALANPEDLARARDSIHERHVVDLILDPQHFEAPKPSFLVPSEDFHPGVAVVDLDRDGFDDFYVMARWGPNMFFRNRGDGSFEEIAAQLGLDIENHSSSAIFADFDNDGDADLLLGRTLARSQYLINEGGRFTERSKSHISEPLPYFTSSVSAVDYDGDGLLDLYLSTYAKVPMGKDFTDKKGRIENGLLADSLPQREALRLAKLRLAPDFHQFINHPGPPNVLLRNVGGGRFEVVREIAALQIFRNTFQATWADFDGDGDADVYVANDFGPNNLVRNDGDGRFTDVTSKTRTADVGFGMGVSWGDYDNDGRPDLYVSNMYSSAGNRILKKLEHVSDTFLGTARGNTLFRNRGESFDKVSGTQAPALAVEKAGWSWGGQFADLDNDGYQDVYALSGFYTASKKVAIERDL